jgi:hypothetical protein
MFQRCTLPSSSGQSLKKCAVMKFHRSKPLNTFVTWKILTLQHALELIRQGQLGIKPAARAFNIPVATLHHAARRRKISSPMQQGGNHVVSHRNKIKPATWGHWTWKVYDIVNKDLASLTKKYFHGYDQWYCERFDEVLISTIILISNDWSCNCCVSMLLKVITMFYAFIWFNSFAN